MPIDMFKGAITPDSLPADMYETAIAKTVAEGWEDANRLCWFLLKLPQRSEIRYNFSHFESNPLEYQYDTVAAAAAAAATTISVTNGDKFLKEQLLFIYGANGTELLYTTGNPDATGTANVTVRRNVDAAGAIVLAAGDIIINLGIASGDGGKLKEAALVVPTEIENYTQNFRRTIVKLTGRQKNTTMRTGDEARRQRKEGILAFRSEIERSFIWSNLARFYNADGDLVTTPRGFLNSITTNVYTVATLGNANTTLTENEWNEFIEIAFWKKTGSRKTCIMSSALIGIINTFNTGKLQYNAAGADMGFGRADAKVPLVCHTPMGILDVIEHAQLFNYGVTSGTLLNSLSARLSVYGALAIVVDPNQLQLAVHQGRGFKLTTYDKKDLAGEDKYIEEVEMDIGPDVWKEDFHSVLNANDITATA